MMEDQPRAPGLSPRGSGAGEEDGMRQRRDPETLELFEAVQPELPLGPIGAAAPSAAPPRLPGTAEPQLPRPWLTLLQALTDALRVLEDGHWLTLSERRHRHFVTVSTHGAAGVLAETDKGRESERSPQQRATDAGRLARLGWERLPLDKNARNGVARCGEHLREWSHPAPIAPIALLVVRTLREVWGVQHPRDLLYAAFDTSRHDILLPALRLNRLPRRPGLPDTGHLLRPASQRELVDAVLTALQEHTRVASLAAADDGSIGLRRRAVSVRVHVGANTSEVDIFATLATDTEAAPELLDVINDANVRNRSAKFFFCRGIVYAFASVRCEVFVPELFTGAFADLLDDAESFQRVLRERFPGTMFIDDDFEWADADGYRLN
jgi:hypothetical protein